MSRQQSKKHGQPTTNGYHLTVQAEPTEETEIDESELFDEAPGIALVSRFSAAVTRVPWFARVAETLDIETRGLAQQYVAALGFPDAFISMVEDWSDADVAAANLDWDSSGWEAEEQLRVSLMEQARGLVGEENLTLLLAHVNAAASDPIEIGVREAAALYDVEDATLIDAAIGAAAQACHLAALALVVADDPDHPFILKFRLFETGRWPIGIAGNSFNLF